MAKGYSYPDAGYFCGVRLCPQPNSASARWANNSDSPWLVSTALPTGKPTAFTLLELLFVLAVLAMLSSVALPRVERMLAKAEHRAAADSLHAALSQLRLKAIQTGRSHSFRFVPGSGIFELRAESIDEVGQLDFAAVDNLAGGEMDKSLEQYGSEDDSQNPGGENSSLADWAGANTLTEPLDDSGEYSTGSDSLTGDQVERLQLTGQFRIISSLEEETTSAGEFVSNSTVDGQAERGEEEDVMGELLDASLTDDSTAAQWSAPILFFPDGRARDARLFVVAPSGYFIEITVVGISGKVRVGNRRRAPEGASRLDLPANVQIELTKI